ncbi:MAG: PTS transporter subunit EIIC [Coriobacteriales bacterium]|nr:PTS transporter subunit EIIC [Coriobacteriales bacterium]
MGNFIQNTILPAFMKFVNTRGVRAIKDGMMFSMPLIIVGAVYLLLFQLPIESAANFVASLGNGAVVSYLAHGYTSTFQMTAVVTAIGVGYTWAKNEGFEPLSSGIISLAVFLILIPDYVGAVIAPDETGALAVSAVDSVNAAAAAAEASGGTATATVVSGLNKTWLAGQGMIGAMIAGLLVGLIYSAFLRKDIRIKMPEGVPDGVAAAFTGLIPAAVICTGALVVYGICDAIGGVTPIELINRFVQTPLQAVGDSLPGVILFEFLIPLFWFFGVHGATVVGSVASPISQANQLENAAIFERLTNSGLSRADAIAQLGANGGHIFTEAFQNCFQAITGSGITLGLVIFMVFFAKSAQMKQVGKLGLGCGIFNINEPVLFGTPIVLNPKLLIPFIAAPLVSNIGAYILTDIGFIPYTMGVTVPWTTPPILSGLIVCGWQGALWQAITLVASFFIYMPFAKSVDNDYLAQEQGEAA